MSGKQFKKTLYFWWDVFFLIKYIARRKTWLNIYVSVGKNTIFTVVYIGTDINA